MGGTTPRKYRSVAVGIHDSSIIELTSVSSVPRTRCDLGKAHPPRRRDAAVFNKVRAESIHAGFAALVAFFENDVDRFRTCLDTEGGGWRWGTAPRARCIHSLAGDRKEARLLQITRRGSPAIKKMTLHPVITTRRCLSASIDGASARKTRKVSASMRTSGESLGCITPTLQNPILIRPTLPLLPPQMGTVRRRSGREELLHRHTMRAVRKSIASPLRMTKTTTRGAVIMGPILL